MIALDLGADEDMDSDKRDALTGLVDAVQAKVRIARWLDEWRRDGTGDPLHAMLIAVGRIDTVNLAYGETTGDSVLVEIAQRVLHFAADEFEAADWFARFRTRQSRCVFTADCRWSDAWAAKTDRTVRRTRVRCAAILCLGPFTGRGVVPFHFACGR